ncbi:hypothetical protein BGX34_010676 [Mortierella sp. NVP85]|nr:hypothetical protein BGX34_010676 [Mortierella sp. NVP85]
MKQDVLPLSPPIFKNWVISRVSHARELFQKQNYMQALAVIDSAKKHDYMREFSINPSLARKKTLSYLQDLHLVEYCCRLVCAHETQMGNIDIVETLKQLNSSVLRPIHQLQTRTRTDYRSVFQLYQDPLVDYTLAVITRNWNQLVLERGSRLTSTDFSAEQVVFASAALPFLRAIMKRHLFPSTSFLLDDVSTTHLSGPNPRTAVLDICLAANNYRDAMRWIWHWDFRDRKDWVDLWNQPDTKQLLVTRLSQSSQPDWTMDLFRLANRGLGTPHYWLQDLVTAMSDDTSSTIACKGHSLKGVLRIFDVDASAFPSKKLYYDLDSWNQFDHLEAWLSGLQNIRLDSHLERKLADEHLWREIAVIGVLSKVLAPIDIVQSVDVEVLAAICSDQSPLRRHVHSDVSKTAANSVHHDTLTDYLGNEIPKDQHTSLTRGDEKATAHREAVQARLLLKDAIQQIMARYTTEGESSRAPLNSYQELLHNVSTHAAVRLGHLGLISQVCETRFRNAYGDQLWNQTVLNSVVVGSTDNCISNDTWPEIESSKEVLGFLNEYMRPMLARLCVSVVDNKGSSTRAPEGQFSDWFMSMAEKSVATGPMARVVQHNGQLNPNSRAYHQAMNTLLEYQEFDLAVDLHSNVYRLREDTGPQDGITRPDAKELGMLIHALATCDTDPRHLNQAQWIFDRHLEKEKALMESSYSPPKNQLVDIQMLTVLGGAWFRRAEFSKARNVLETMWERGLQPNMILYNTLLKALLDLTPYTKSGKRTMGTGKQAGMRELAREIMIQQLLKSKSVDPASSNIASRDSAPARKVLLGLDEGWNIFQDIIATASQQSFEPSIPTKGPDASSMLKTLAMGTAPAEGAEDGNFRPDLYTFSNLLESLGRRGHLESISELFVEMKQLGLEPDVMICSILANAFAKCGDLKAMDRVVQEARVRGLDPGLHLTNVVMDSLVESGVSASKIRETLDGMVERASEFEEPNLADEMEIPVPKFGTTSYRLKSSSPTNNRRLPRHAWDQSKPGMDSVTLTTLIKYHTRHNDLCSAHEIFRLMVEAGIVPDNRVYVLLLGASIRTQDVASGLSTLRAMRVHSRRFPDSKAWKGLLRCAMDLELEMEKQLRVPRRLKKWHQQGERAETSTFNIESQGIADSLRDTPQESPVVSVLLELESVLLDIRRGRMDSADSVSDHAGIAAKEYLNGILTSSWLTLSHMDDAAGGNIKSEGESDRMRRQNSEIKGKNGLLRRLLNHLLRAPSVHRGGSTSQAQAGHQLSPSPCSLDVGTEIPPSQQQKAAVEEPTMLETEQRCEHAIWLVRLVESVGIELGMRWKNVVVVSRIRSLTGWEPILIMKRLGDKAQKKGRVGGSG